MLKLACSLALALAPGGPPLWQDRADNGGWWVQRPPERFRTGQGVAAVVYVAPGQTARTCRAGGAVACAIAPRQAGDAFILVMPDPCAAEFARERYAQLQCHENSHAFGGWKHEAL